jgi:hypothetical protein
VYDGGTALDLEKFHNLIAIVLKLNEELESQENDSLQAALSTQVCRVQFEHQGTLVDDNNQELEESRP